MKNGNNINRNLDATDSSNFNFFFEISNLKIGNKHYEIFTVVTLYSQTQKLKPLLTAQ